MNTLPPLISICIPAYKNAAYLSRLLDSIAKQNFRDFEVVIADDSPDNSLQVLVDQYKNVFPIFYKKNSAALGTPENWNAAIRNANGQWIKLMHDDDWFSSESSLQDFVDAIQINPGVNFIFSGFNNVYLEKNVLEKIVASPSRLQQLKKTPMILVAKNIVGPPSTTMLKNDKRFWYDKEMKWFVDIDFYMQVLETSDFLYINEPLINVGIHEQQVTTYTFKNPAVEIPEGMLLINKHPDEWDKNIIAYDGWWRYLRNLSIRRENDILNYAPGAQIPPVLKKMIRFQSRIPAKLLMTGLVSKTLMSIAYLANIK